MAYASTGGLLETMGSIKATAPQQNRLPIVEGWTLRDVYDGTATVAGRQGIFDVIPGDPLPGVGRVDAIRLQGWTLGGCHQPRPDCRTLSIIGIRLSSRKKAQDR